MRSVIAGLSLALSACAGSVSQSDTESAYTMSWHNGDGVPVAVRIYPTALCPTNPEAQACAIGNSIFLNNNPHALPHELAHIAGMKHTLWYGPRGYPRCAKVLAGDYDGRYQVGDVICIGFNGGEFMEAKSNGN